MAPLPSSRFSQSSERGATFVEGAIVLPVVLIAVIISFDLMRMAFNFLSLQYAARSVLREAMVGTVVSSDIPATVVERAAAVGVQVDQGEVKFCPLASFPACPINVITDRAVVHGISVSLPPRGLLAGALNLAFTNFRLQATALSRREPA